MQKDSEKGEIVLEAVDLYKRFRGTWALRGVNLSIGEGFTVIIGPNGSGKSSLLLAATGFIRPTRGRVRLRGLDPFRDGDRLSRIVGFSPDPPSLPPFSSVGELVRISIDAGSVDEKLVVENLEKLGLGPHMGKRVIGLSAGLRKRLSIALACSKSSANVVLLDEPFANLDRDGILRVSELISGLLRRGISVIIATHIVALALPQPDYLVLMAEGKVVSAGEAVKVSSSLRALGVEIPRFDEQLMAELVRTNRDILVEKGRIIVKGLSGGEAADLVNKYGGRVLVDLGDVLQKSISPGNHPENTQSATP